MAGSSVSSSPPQAGWILIIALLAVASLVSSAKGLLAVAGGRWGSWPVRASVPVTFPWWFLNPGRRNGDAPWLQVRQKGDVPGLLQLLHPGRSEAGAPGLQLPFLIMVGHWHDTWPWTQLTSLCLFHILKNWQHPLLKRISVLFYLSFYEHSQGSRGESSCTFSHTLIQ